MTRVVSISPNAIDHDSRTYKFAASAARMGLEAVVVESERSKLNGEPLPFKLVSPPAESPPPVDEATAPVPPAARTGGLVQKPLAVMRSLLGPLRNSIFIVRANLRDYWDRNRRTSALLPDADVYWLHSFWSFPAVYLKARRQRARFLYDAPDSHWEPGEWTASDRASRAVIRMHERLERSCARRAERFSTVSDGVAGLMEERFGRRPEVIRNSHDFRMDEECDLDIRKEVRVGPDDFLMVMSGSLKPGTTVTESLEALDRLPESVHLAFLAPGAAVSDDVLDAIERHPRAVRHPGVPPSQVASFMAGADASPLLYRAHSMNYKYALPNGFFHAVAAGLPLLYPPLPEISRLAEAHGLGVAMDPEDPDSLAAGVSRLLDDPEATAGYAANARDARDLISWERDEAIVAEILGSGKAA